MGGGDGRTQAMAAALKSALKPTCRAITRRVGGPWARYDTQKSYKRGTHANIGHRSVSPEDVARQTQRVSDSPAEPTRRAELRELAAQNPKFQLEYTLMVVAVTVAVAAVLGERAYEYSTGQTEMLKTQKVMQADPAEQRSMRARRGITR